MPESLLPRFRIILGESRWIAGFKIEPDVNFFRRILGQKTNTTIIPAIEELILKTRDKAQTVAVPSAVYGIFNPDETLSRWFPGAVCVALAVVTIGSAMDTLIDQSKSDDELTKSFLLDAWGSAFTEGAVDTIYRVLTQEAQLLGYTISKRRSPGYGKWELFDQKTLMNYLPISRIDVRISDACSFIPRKTVSFGCAIGL